uniref:Uncharacterized protein n=1 Tax=Quercus lobata TaxID=97700 RepID=A0A7N2R5J7_QUELO
MLWAIAGSDKLEKTKVRRNLVGERSLEGLGLRTLLFVVVGLFLLGNSFSYGERTFCATHYHNAGAPVVLENLECSSWFLSKNKRI